MTCPFSNARVPGVEDGGAGGGGGGRLFGSSGRAWERGTSIDANNSSGSPVRQLGSVQERVNSYTRMTRSPSEPVAVRRKASGGTARRCGDVRARFKGGQEDGDDETPLLTPARNPPDPNQPLSIQNLTEAVWCFITIPVSVSFLSSRVGYLSFSCSLSPFAAFHFSLVLRFLPPINCSSFLSVIFCLLIWI